MRAQVKTLGVLLLAGAIAGAIGTWSRIRRVDLASAAIPLHPGARSGGGKTRYFPRLISWDDRSSARVQRVFALDVSTSLTSIALAAYGRLATEGWYLVDPDDLNRVRDPEVIVWQRDPDERLDLTQLWPMSGVSREQRLYGGVFPREFLDAPMVFQWSWALGGPRSARSSASDSRSIVRSPVLPRDLPDPPAR